MNPVLFLEYPKCSTCKKAKKWLDENGIQYTDRHIVEDNPTAEELAQWHAKSDLPIRRLFTQAVCSIANRILRQNLMKA